MDSPASWWWHLDDHIDDISSRLSGLIAGLCLAAAVALLIALCKKIWDAGESTSITGVIVQSATAAVTATSLMLINSNWANKVFGTWKMSDRSMSIAKLCVSGLLLVCTYFACRKTASFYADHYWKLAVAADRSEKYAEASVLYSKTIALSPKNAMAYYNLGFVDEKLGRVDDEINNFQTAIDLDPSYGPAYTMLARAMILYKKDCVRAIKVLDASTAYRQDQWTASAVNRDYGWAMIRLGYPGRAVQYLQDSLRGTQNQIGSHCLLAKALIDLNDPRAYKEAEICKRSNDDAKDHPDAWVDRPEPDWVLDAERMLEGKQ
jgi:tetratricopeptide (TPR) repeat protein